MSGPPDAPAPIDAVEAALHAALSSRLIGAGLIVSAAHLADKPVDPLSLKDAPGGGRFVCALVRVGPRVRRVYVGGGAAVYQLDLLFNFEFAAVSPDAATRAAQEGRAQGVVAAVLTGDPTLGGAAQRLDLEDGPQLDDAPAAVITAIPLAASVIAGDPLARTPAT